MLDIHIEPNPDKGTMRGNVSMNGTMMDILEECLFAVQYMFETLMEKDVAAAITFMNGCTEGLPFVYGLNHKKCNNCEDCDCHSNESDAEESEEINDLKPIFKGIMFTNGKGDSKNETN